MQNRPTAAELLDVIRDLLTDDLLPLVTDDGLRFKTRIAINLLSIVERELETGDSLIDAELNRLHTLLPEMPIDPAVSPVESILALNRILADTIRHAPADSDLVAIHGEVWDHIRTTLRDQLTIAAPKFDVSR